MNISGSGFSSSFLFLPTSALHCSFRFVAAFFLLFVFPVFIDCSNIATYTDIRDDMRVMRSSRRKEKGLGVLKKASRYPFVELKVGQRDYISMRECF